MAVMRMRGLSRLWLMWLVLWMFLWCGGDCDGRCVGSCGECGRCGGCCGDVPTVLEVAVDVASETEAVLLLFCIFLGFIQSMPTAVFMS